MNANLGMYIEQLMDRTGEYYFNNNLGFLEKRQIPIKIFKHINDTTIIGKLIAKSKVDYFGIINKKYIEIECKQTNNNYFDMMMLKKHQLEYLKKSLIYCYENYIFIYFELRNITLAITYKKLVECKKKIKINKIPFEEIVKYGKIIEIVYPGILQLSKLF